jgi:hypothetical protein
MDPLVVVLEVSTPLIGSCGGVGDRHFDTLETDLDWLEVRGVAVLRIDPTNAEEDR